MKTSIAPKLFLPFIALMALMLSSLTATWSVTAVASFSGAIFTTNSACTGTNINLFASKDDVYLDGGR